MPLDKELHYISDQIRLLYRFCFKRGFELQGQKSLGLIWWMLAREVLIIKGKISRQMGFEIEGKEIMPDLYFYRDPEEVALFFYFV